MMAGPVPRALARYVQEIARRERAVEDLRNRVRALSFEMHAAEYRLSEAHRDLREVHRKWQLGVTVARQVKRARENARMLPLPGQVSRVLLEKELERVAGELSVSPNELLRAA